MNGELISLGPVQLATAAVLLVGAAAVSLALKLGVAKRLFWAALRTVLQLGLLGLILDEIFALDTAWLVLALVVAMTLFAAREAIARSARLYRGVFFDGWFAIASSCLIIGGVVTQLVVGVEPWYHPQYVIPLLGMILGNSFTGISLALDRLLEHFASRSDELELRLAFGATRREVLRQPLQAAVRTGMIPILNSMAAAGIVSLPGMMTGQILACSPPLQAVAYQIVVMFMIAAANAWGAMVLALIAAKRIVAPDGSLRLELLRERS